VARVQVPEADAIVDQEFSVLDHGFVRLVDYLGGDARIVQAARVSYGGGTKTFRQDRGLINYLMRNRHTSPFEQVVLTFHAKMPVFVARQWVRHRTARLNEISGRYSVMEDQFYLPDSAHINAQSTTNRQGRDHDPLPPEVSGELRNELASEQRAAYERYEDKISRGLAREVARINLPLSLYTQWYWQIDLHNLFHFLELRLDPHAQYEIRAYAEVILDIARRVAPLACEAFEEHRRKAVSLSGRELDAVRSLLGGAEGIDDAALRAAAEEAGLSGKAIERFVEKLRSGTQS